MKKGNKVNEVHHGDQDELVDLKCVEHAKDLYESAKLQVICEGHHGFYGLIAVSIAADVIAFMKENIQTKGIN